MKQILRKTLALKAFMFLAMLVGSISGAWADTFTKVTSTNDLEANANYILVAESANKVLGSISTTSTKYGIGVDATITEDGIIESTEEFMVLTLSGGTSDGWIFSNKDNDCLAWSSGNSLYASESIYRWDIDFTEEGNVYITSRETSDRKIRWNASSPRFACYTSAQTDIQLYKQSSSKVDAGISFDSEKDYFEVTLGDAFSAPTLKNPNGLTVTFESSNKAVATVDETGKVTLVGGGLTTITASTAATEVYNAGKASYTIKVTDPNANDGSEESPFTVTEAIAFINTLGTATSEQVYVKGIISKIDEYRANFKSITYWISDDGTTDNQMEVYSGLGLDKAEFSSINDLHVGDKVTVTGNVKLYNNIPEFNYNNWLVSYESDFVPETKADIIATYAGVTELEVGEETDIILIYENKPEDLEFAINFESSDASIVKVEGDKLIAVAPGAAQISAVVPEGETWNAFAIEFTITVKEQAEVEKPLMGVTFQKVTSTAQLTDGEYLIVFEEGAVAFDGSLETLDAAGNGIGVTIEDGVIGATDKNINTVFTITATENGYTIQSKSGLYIGQTSDANGLKAQEEAIENSITFSEEEGALISAAGAVLRYNATSGQTRFRYYKSATYDKQQPVALYKLTPVIADSYYTREVGEGNYGTICLPYDATVSGATLYNIGGVFLGHLVLLEQSNDIPAGEARVFKATSDKIIATYTSDEKVDYTFGVKGLYGVLDDLYWGTAEEHQPLLYMFKDNQVVPIGSNCTIKANRAYISMREVTNFTPTTATPEIQNGVKVFINDNATGISNVKAQQAGEAFDLTGRRVNAVKNGLYIINGKKVVR